MAIGFTPEEQKTWTILFDQQTESLQGRCRPEWFAAAGDIGLRRDEVPDTAWLNDRLAKLTGWRVAQVDGSLKVADFFELTGSKCFPISSRMRTRDELGHARIPDIFHDVFGHVPLLAIPAISDFLLAVSRAALRCRADDATLARFSRILAWTLEFGLMGDVDAPCVYGAGLITSSSELDHVLGGGPVKRRFEPAQVVSTGHLSAELQSEYFVVESFERLGASLDECVSLASAG